MASHFYSFPLVIGHRGDPSRATENTLTSLSAGLGSGADMLEFDVRASLDEIPLLFHDEDTFRLTGMKQSIGETTYDDLMALELPGKERIATLDEALDLLLGKIPINIEVKCPRSFSLLEEALKSRPSGGTVLVSSFLLPDLNSFKKRNPGALTSALIRNPSKNDFRTAAEGGHLSVNMNQRFFRKSQVKGAGTLGLSLMTYTVDARLRFEALAGAGVIGFFTNLPREMAEWKKELKKA